MGESQAENFINYNTNDFFQSKNQALFLLNKSQEKYYYLNFKF